MWNILKLLYLGIKRRISNIYFLEVIYLYNVHELLSNCKIFRIIHNVINMNDIGFLTSPEISNLFLPACYR